MCEPERSRLPVGRVVAVLGAAVVLGAAWAVVASAAEAFALAVFTVDAVLGVLLVRAWWQGRPVKRDAIRYTARAALPAPPLAIEAPRPAVQGVAVSGAPATARATPGARPGMPARPRPGL